MILDNVELLIGGQLIDRHSGQFLSLFNELNKNVFQDENYNKRIETLTDYTWRMEKRHLALTTKYAKYYESVNDMPLGERYVVENLL